MRMTCPRDNGELTQMNDCHRQAKASAISKRIGFRLCRGRYCGGSDRGRGSQVGNIGLSVIRKLYLTDDPEFVGGTKGPIGRLIAVIGRLTKFAAAEEALSEIDQVNTALLKFNGQRTLSRVGMTYVIDIGFTPRSRQVGADRQRDCGRLHRRSAKYQATRRASLWLQERIAELRTQATAAERAVLDQRQKQYRRCRWWAADQRSGENSKHS
jgi:hypothetical protein